MKIGNEYEDKYGDRYIFLGARYLSECELFGPYYQAGTDGDRSKEYFPISKIEKKDFGLSTKDNHIRLCFDAVKDLGHKKEKKECDKLLIDFARTRERIACFSKTKPKKEEYELKEILFTEEDLKDTFTTNSIYINKTLSQAINRDIIEPNIVQTEDNNFFYNDSSITNFGSSEDDILDIKEHFLKDRLLEVYTKKYKIREGLQVWSYRKVDINNFSITHPEEEFLNKKIKKELIDGRYHYKLYRIYLKEQDLPKINKEEKNE